MSDRLDVYGLACLCELPDEVRVDRKRIDGALAELGLVGLALQVGSDDVGPICSDPRCPND